MSSPPPLLLIMRGPSSPCPDQSTLCLSMLFHLRHWCGPSIRLIKVCVSILPIPVQNQPVRAWVGQAVTCITRSLSYLGIIGSSVQCPWNIQKKYVNELKRQATLTHLHENPFFLANINPTPLEKNKCSYSHNSDTIRTVTSLSIYWNLACNTSFL